MGWITGAGGGLHLGTARLAVVGKTGARLVMIVLEFELPEEIGELFARVLTGIEAKLNGQLARDVELPDDPEMIELWSDELRAQLRDDLSALDRVFSHPDFGAGAIGIEDEEAERLIRAISACRLAIRRLDLAQIEDADLEGGILDPTQIVEVLRPSYLCYLFFGGLQEMLIEALDPGAVVSREELTEFFGAIGDDGAESSEEDENDDAEGR